MLTALWNARWWPGRTGRRVLFIACLLFASSLAGVAQLQYLQESARLFEQNDLSGAESQARLALTDLSTRAVAYSILGAIRFRQAKYEQSAGFLEKALRLNPHLIGAEINLGNVYVLEGRKSQASLAFNNALKLDHNNFNARFALARLEGESGHYAASLELARPIDSQLRRTDEGLVLLASDELGMKDERAAEGLIEDWLELDNPAHPATLSMAGIYADHELFKDAISILEHGENKGGDSFDIDFALGENYLRLDDLDEAKAEYNLALERRQGCAECLDRLGRIAEQEDHLDEALSDLLKARRDAPADPEVLFEFGKLCVKKGLYLDSISSLSAALKLQPANEKFQYVLASAYTGTRQFKPAIAILRHLVILHPKDPLLNYSLGSVQYLESDLSGAESHLQLSIRLNPQQLGSYYYLGLIKDQQGNSDAAAQIFESLAKRNPDDPATLTALGRILFAQRKLPEAQTVLERAVKLDPSSIKAHYQLGMVLGRLGQREASRREFAAVKSLNAVADKQTEMRIFSLDQ